MSKQIITLQPGVYQIPNNCKAHVRDGKVFVGLKINEQRKRCRDCKFFGIGRIKLDGNPFYEICLHKPKPPVKTGYTPEMRALPRFYRANKYQTACKDFEQKTNH